jgi:hypothetical protein
MELIKQLTWVATDANVGHFRVATGRGASLSFLA